MTSINTNNSAMAALQTLRGINKSLSDTQAHVSSGLRVGAASDNAAYWSIATTMRSDNGALSAVNDALGLGAAKVDTAYAGMNAAIDVVAQIKTKLVTATEEGVDKNKVQEEISQLQEQLRSVAQSASFSGQNWIAGGVDTATGPANVSVVSGFVRDANGSVSVKSTQYSLDATTAGGMSLLFGGDANGALDYTNGILGTVATGWTTVDFNDSTPAIDGATSAAAGMSINTLDIKGFDAAAMGEALKLVDAGLKAMTSVAAKLGSISTRIDLQTDFVSKLSDSVESGIGKLVDADMEEESSKLSALQTQQQLAVQSLSIANSSSQNILSLFRG